MNAARMSSPSGFAWRSLSRVAAVSATIRTCCPNAASPEVEPRRAGMEHEPGARHVTDGDAIGVIDHAAVGRHPQQIRLAGEGIGKGREVRIAVAGDSRAHLGGGGDGPLDDRRVLRLELGAPLRVDANKQPTAVVRIRLAANEPGALEPIEHAGHRPAREVAELGEPRRRHLLARSAASSRHRRSVALRPRLACHDLVRPDRLGDQAPQARWVGIWG